MTNPLEALFRTAGVPQHGNITRHEKITSVAHSHFIRRLYATAPTDVGVFIDNDVSRQVMGSKVHIIMPFFGGPDDRLALEFVVQLCGREEATATIFRVTKEAPLTESESEGKTEGHDKEQTGESAGGEGHHPEIGHTIHNTIHSQVGRYPDTIYPNVTTQTRLASDTADNICWFKYAPAQAGSTAPERTPRVVDALNRVTFNSLASPTPLNALVQQAAEKATAGRLIVVVGRAKRLAVESHQDEMKTILGDQHGFGHGGLGNEIRQTIGDVATAFVVSGVSAGLLVMQATPASKAEV